MQITVQAEGEVEKKFLADPVVLKGVSHVAIAGESIQGPIRWSCGPWTIIAYHLSGFLALAQMEHQRHLVAAGAQNFGQVLAQIGETFKKETGDGPDPDSEESTADDAG